MIEKPVAGMPVKETEGAQVQAAECIEQDFHSENHLCFR
jgi:hypothetical protein